MSENGADGIVYTGTIPVSGGRNELCSYIHIDDAAHVTQKAIGAGFVGHERFWAVASDTTLALGEDVDKRQYSDAELTEPLLGHRAFVDIEKSQK